MPEIELDAPSRPAFSLLELLIVILLVSVFALLVFASMKRSAELPKVSISKIKELPGTVSKAGSELVCVDRCRTCYLWDLERGTYRDFPSDLPPLKAYLVDESGEPRAAEFGRYRDRKICLRFRYSPTGGSSRMIIEARGRYYYFPSFFGRVKRFGSLEEAVAYWKRFEGRFTSKGEYY